MLNDVLSILIFIAPFIAIAFLFFAKTSKWRRNLIGIWGCWAMLAFVWYLTMLRMMQKIEEVDIIGFRPNPNVLPLYWFVGSSWMPFLYAAVVVALGYLAIHHSSRNVGGR